MRIVMLGAVLMLAACSASPSPGVPSLGGTAGAAPPTAGGCIGAADGLNQLIGDTGQSPAPGASKPAGDGGAPNKDLGYQPTCAGATGDARRSALHAAADCIRQHGISTYKDPVLTADGHVFTDSRSLHKADGDTVLAAAQACHDLIVAADLVPDAQAPAPPALVQAGVKSARCMRSNGLPNYRDPSANDEFTPGHGFGVHPEDLPGDKTDPTVQHALEACRTVLDAEAQASSLGSLAG
ncbi:hypothetical protein [Dactylosporangium sp. CS-033363]|uniref:hypothetical protein n=1 Tax=Dactylosporangium sp. CS-033363 TaxID=3239935 RepID=UPI003D8B1A0B